MLLSPQKYLFSIEIEIYPTVLLLPLVSLIETSKPNWYKKSFHEKNAIQISAKLPPIELILQQDYMGANFADILIWGQCK